MSESYFTDYVSDRDLSNVPVSKHNRDLSNVPHHERWFTRFKQMANFHPNLVSRARRAAARVGWRIVKARGNLHENNRGGLQIVDRNNIVVDGLNFDLTAQEALDLCASQSPSPPPEIKIDLCHTTERGVYGFVYVGETRIGFSPPACVVQPESIVIWPVRGWPLMPREDRGAAAEALRQRFPDHVVSL